MNGSGFQAFAAQLGGLSEGQRKALLTALKRKLPIEEAAELIETHFKAAFKAVPCCGHCGSTSVGVWSSQNGLARYRCI